MLTRGIIIGKLVDDLSVLQGQIDLRCQIGLTDLNKYCEDFFKELLNICYSLNLKNLNNERSNEPGLDLGDQKNKIAFQITSTSTSEKVNNTLEKITVEQQKQYDSIKVFILGKKQQTYSAVKPELLTVLKFDIGDIMDISDLARQIVVLKYDELYQLHKLFEKEFQIVITEIEIPNAEGVYPTSLIDKYEITPNTMCENAHLFIDNYEGNDLRTIGLFYSDLAKLPRITREFLSLIVSHGEWSDGNYYVDFNEFKRKLKWPLNEVREEIDILSNRRFISAPDADDPTMATRFKESGIDIVDYAQQNGLISKIMVAMDFTVLDK
ncbi:SMEK domain-containing protein [Flavobacterium piscisymbiosum]|uniref:SMEK domain-containing protein n=1 Tax=Flavobacterium piscisymbiosum TaxID=2893753 RepID=A0ABS8MFH6_9FLAO|nr:SMEK domain-containing protein [Flavobacterium sp. F-30]MCC9063721.1 SMEK domain-containing protein [Flavobacterium sp. F-30]